MGIFNDMKDKATDKIKKQIVNIMKIFLIKAAIILLIVVSTITLLASFWYILKKDTVTQTSSAIREDGDNLEININEGQRNYNLDEEFEKRLEELLEDLEINAESVGLTEELLKEMYISEIITTFPDLRTRDKIGTEVSKGEIQGCIQFRRNYPDGTQETLEYMEFDKFRAKLAKLGYDLQDAEGNSISVDQISTSKAEVDSNYRELRRYFTLDEEYNVIIPTLNSDETSTIYSDYAKEEEKEDEYNYNYYLDIKKINYRSLVEKYAMPLEFTLTMLTISENPEFCTAIMELVKDSEIVIEINDNLKTTTTVEKYDYDAYFNIYKKVNYTVEVEVEEEVENPEEGELEEENPEQEDEEQEDTEQENPEQDNNQQEDEENDNPPTIVKPGGSQNKPTTGFTPELMYYSDDTDLKYEFLSQIKIVKTATITRESASAITSNDKHLKQKDIDNTPFKTTTEILTESSINLCVVQAKTWLLDAEVVYTRNETTENTIDSVLIDDDQEYKQVSDWHSFLANFEMSLEPGAQVTGMDSSSYIQEKQVNKENKINTTIENITYTKTSSIVEEKEEKFLSLLSVDPSTNIFNKQDINRNTKLIKYEDIYGRDTSPESNLLISKDILFEILSSNERSQPFEEIMRYLLYIYTGKSYGVTSLDFSIYEPTSFTAINGGSSGISGIQGQIYDYLLSKGMSGIGAAAILGNIERESSFRVSAINKDNPHYGLCQWGGTRFERLKSEAEKVGKTWQDLQVQLDFLWLELNSSYSSTGEELMNATDLYSAVDYFTRNYEVCGNYDTEVDIRYEYAQKWYNLASQNNHSGVDDIEKYNLNVYKGFIEYKQLDYTVIPPAYQATSSPAGTIKDKGCMPTSISIILSGMGVKDAWGNAYTPETLISTGTIAHINGGSSTAANARNTFTKCGLTASQVRSTSSSQAKNDILSNLNAGNAILIHAAEGYYTSGGHLMTLIDVDGNQVYLSNPGSRNKTGWVSLNTLISRNVDWYMVVSR